MKTDFVWREIICGCCGKRWLGARRLAVRGHAPHPPMKFCVVGLIISVN